MRRLLEHKPGERVTIDGAEYDVVATNEPRLMCKICALNGAYYGKGA